MALRRQAVGMIKVLTLAVAIVLASAVAAQCENGMQFYIMGINLQWLKNAKGGDVASMVAGAAAAVGAHVLGHYLAGQAFDVDFAFERSLTSERITGYHSDSDVRWFARGGFVLEHGIGLALTSFESGRKSSFTRGYVGAAALETWGYNLMNRGSNDDFRCISLFGGDGDLEHGIYSLIAAHNVLRLQW